MRQICRTSAMLPNIQYLSFDNINLICKNCVIIHEHECVYAARSVRLLRFTSCTQCIHRRPCLRQCLVYLHLRFACFQKQRQKMWKTMANEWGEIKIAVCMVLCGVAVLDKWSAVAVVVVVVVDAAKCSYSGISVFVMVPEMAGREKSLSSVWRFYLLKILVFSVRLRRNR